MKSTKAVINDNKQYRNLINAVVRQLGGNESIEDINRHGIDGGFGGFIYYSDTCKFYRKNRKAINSLVFDMANQLGEYPVNMVLSFRCVNNDEHDNVGRCIYGGKLNDDTTQVENALAWFAAEEVCRMFEND